MEFFKVITLRSKTVIGRGSDCDLVLNESEMSRRHALIENTQEGLFLRDLGSANGTLVYLNAGPSLDAWLARVPAAGGSVALPKVTLPDGMGCFAHIIDSEGNRVGLHALA